jgi:cytochrome c-type biogenesis protein CcmH
MMAGAGVTAGRGAAPTRTTRRATTRAIAVLLAATALVAVSVPVASAAAVHQRARVQQMYDLLMCTLCHESLAVAQSPQSYSERALVREYVSEGLTVKQIENRMVAQYGAAVLAQPPKHGFSLLVYIVPPVVVVGGIALLLYTVPRWRLRTAAARNGTDEPTEPPLSERESQRLDRELADGL